MAATKPDVAALVEQMPDTDNEVQARQKPEPDKPDQAKPKARPERDRFGAASKFTGPDPAAAQAVFGAILAGGRESLLELIGLLRDPGDPDFKNYKAGYVLHGVALFAGRPGQEAQRRMFAETLAAQLENMKHSKALRGYFIRELQVAGGPEVVPALAKQLQDDELCEYAAQALIAIREGAAPQLRRALPGAKGRNRVTLVQALGALRDADSVRVLLEALGDSNRDVRLAAVWALANVGDPSAVEALIKSADAAEGWERIQAGKACLLLAEKLAASGQKAGATRLYTHLRDTRKDAERYLGEAAARALNEAL